MSDDLIGRLHKEATTEVARLRELLKVSQDFGAKASSDAARFKAERDAAREEVERMRAVIKDLVTTYEWCSVDPADRGWSTMENAVDDARAALQEGEAARANPAHERDLEAFKGVLDAAWPPPGREGGEG